MTQRVCPKCNAPIPSQARNCPVCRAPIEIEPEEEFVASAPGSEDDLFGDRPVERTISEDAGDAISGLDDDSLRPETASPEETESQVHTEPQDIDPVGPVENDRVFAEEPKQPAAGPEESPDAGMAVADVKIRRREGKKVGQPLFWRLVGVGLLAACLLIGIGCGVVWWDVQKVRPLRNDLETTQQAKRKMEQDVAGVTQDKTKAESTATELAIKLGEVEQSAKQLKESLTQKTADLSKTEMKLQESEANARAADMAAQRASMAAKAELAKREMWEQLADANLVFALNPETALAFDLVAAMSQTVPDPAGKDVARDQFMRVEAALSRAIESTPERAVFYALRARARYAAGVDVADVSMDAEKAAGLDPNKNDPAVQCLLAQTYQLLGRDKEAAEHRTAAMNSHSAGVLRKLAIECATGELDRKHTPTLRLIERAIAMEPVDAAAAERVELRLTRCRLLLDAALAMSAQGQSDEAGPLFEQVVAAATQTAEMASQAKLDSVVAVLIVRGQAMEAMERYDEALATYQEATPLARSDADKSRLAAARVRVRTARALKSTSTAPDKRSSQLTPLRQSMAALNFVTLTVVQQPPEDDNDRAEADLLEAEKAIELAGVELPAAAEAYYSKGLALIRLARYDQAITSLIKGTELLRRTPGPAGTVRLEHFVDAIVRAYAMRTAMSEPDRVKDLAQQLTATTDRLEKTAAQLKADQANLETEKMLSADLRSQLAESEKQLIAAQGAMNQVKQSMQKVQAELDNELAKHDRTKKMLSDRETELATARQSMAQAQQRMEAAEASLKEERARHEETKQRLGQSGPGRFGPRQTNTAADLIYGRGLQAFWRGDYAAAEQTLSEAIRLENDARYLYFRGLSYYKLGQTMKAEDDFREAARLEDVGVTNSYDVASALERIQGPVRLWLESFRSGQPKSLESFRSGQAKSLFGNRGTRIDCE